MQLPHHRHQLDVLEHVLGQDLVEARIREGQRQHRQVVHDINSRQGRGVEVHEAGADIRAAAEIEAFGQGAEILGVEIQERPLERVRTMSEADQPVIGRTPRQRPPAPDSPRAGRRARRTRCCR